MEETFFTATTVTKRFGGVTALLELSLAIERSQIYSLIGPNGAGKSTFFNAVTGFDPPDSGSIQFQGRELVGLPPEAVATVRIARTYQNIRLFKSMTALENVMVGRHVLMRAGLFGAVFTPPPTRQEEATAETRAFELLDFVGLRGREAEVSINLSYGDQRRLEIARALALEPELLLLDEPTAGMSPAETSAVADLVLHLRDERGLTVLLVEHDMSVVMGISDKITVMDYGEEIARGTPDEVRNDPRVLEAYLGGAA